MKALLHFHIYLVFSVAGLCLTTAHAEVQIGTALQSGAKIESVEVFRRVNQQVTGTASGATMTVYVVDQLKGFMDRLSEGLPNTPQAAQRVAQARLQSLTDQDKLWIRNAATAKVRTAQYQLTKTPAIVINGQAVIYGVSDVVQACAIYQRWRGSRP